MFGFKKAQAQYPVAPPKVAVQLKDEERPIIIRIKDLVKTYDIGTPRETKAIRGMNLEISLAEIVVIFGSSGSGKSTLLNILAGLDAPTSGMVEIDGKDLAKMKARDLALYHQYKVGMVFQSYNLVPTFTVMQNITMPARLAGFKRPAYMRRGWDLLKQFDLEALADKLPNECSGGQQQRVGIMRAFMNRPAFIIADEPTGNLDSVNSEHIMKLFQGLNRETNTTMLIVTHDPSLFAIADRVVHVKDGLIVKQTILTKRAKIDPSKVKEPVEFKLRTEEQRKLIEEFGGLKTEEVLVKQAQQAKVLETQKKELESRQQQLAAQVKALQEELIKHEAIERERQAALLALELDLGRIKKAQEELTAARPTLPERQKEEQEFAQQYAEQEKQRLEDEQRRLKVLLEEFAHTRQELIRSRQRLRAQAAQLEEKKRLLEESADALAQERQRFEQDMAARIEVATNILDHEREQLETERQQQAEEQGRRAEVMEKRLAAARQIVQRESAQLTAERRLLTQERARQEAERQALETEKRKLRTKVSRPHPAPRGVQGESAFAQLLNERAALSHTARSILESIATVLSPARRNALKRREIMRIIEAVEFRLYGVFTPSELQNFLDRPYEQGGAGLYRQTAEHVAKSVETMIALGKLALPPRKRRKKP